MDAYVRGVFITGVSKFAKTSIFSGINNLNDISIKPESAALLGYTQEEITHNFEEHIQAFTQSEDINSNAFLEQLRRWYNGYQFTEKEIKMYNPFSVLYCLKDQKFSNYWFESGTPSFLINLLKAQFYSLENVKQLEISSNSLGTFDLERIPLISLLFQTGYLTFSQYNSKTQKFTLDFPNYEVEESFKKYLVSVLSNTSSIEVDSALSKLIRAINSNDLDSFCSTLKTLFAHISYTLHGNKESYYHALLQFLLSLLSLEAQSEVLTNIGRIDLALITKTHIYIFELKVDVKPEIALQQIQKKQYHQKYLGNNKHIVLVGLLFYSKPEKTILECVKQEII